MKGFITKLVNEFAKFNIQQKVAAVVLTLAIPLCLGMGVSSVSGNSDKQPQGTPSPSPTTEATASPSPTVSPSPTPQPDKKVSLIAASIEEDLQVQIVDEKGELILDEKFVLHVKCAANGYSKKWTVDGDGFLRLPTIPSGLYTVTIEEKDGFIMPDKAVTIEVEKKVEYKEIDVSDKVVDASQVDEKNEDAAFEVKPAATPAPPTNTVEYVEYSKTPVKTEYIYKLKGNAAGDTRIYKTDGTPSDYIAKVDANGNITEVYLSPYVASSPRTASLELTPTSLKAKRTSAFNLSLSNMNMTGANPGIMLVDNEGTGEGDGEGGTEPTATPEITPTPEPTAEPTATPEPTAEPTATPEPTTQPTATPEATPTAEPTATPEVTPTPEPTTEPTATPEVTPTTQPTASPTATPTATPTTAPTATPTASPTPAPTKVDFFDKNGKIKDEFKNLRISDESVTTYKYTGWTDIGDKRYYYTKDGKYVTGTQVIQGITYFFGSDGVLNKQRIGIDVSKYQRNIDWKAVKNAGVEFAIIRVGYRGYGSGKLVWDEYFKQNIQGATAAGLKVGVYIFSQAINTKEAVEEASMCLEGVQGYNLAYPIYFDTEYSTSAKTGRADWLTKDQRTKIAQAFCETVRNAGYKPGVYASASWFTGQLNYSSLTSYSIWVAHYTSASKPNFAHKYDIWQYTGSGSCRGVPGAVDMNIGYTYY